MGHKGMVYGMIKFMKKRVGYREIEHTADWELKVWGPDLVSLLKTAASGMYHLSGVKLDAGPRVVREFEINYTDRESLLVDFLAELLFLGEDQQIAFDEYELEICKGTLHVEARGAPIHIQAKEIKAVTYHRMQVQETDRGLEVFIVFDV